MSSVKLFPLAAHFLPDQIPLSVEETKNIIKPQVAKIGLTNEKKAEQISWEVIKCGWRSEQDVDKLRNLGLKIGKVALIRGLPGGEPITVAVLTAFRGLIYLVKGNQKKMTELSTLPTIKFEVELPNNITLTGSHSGNRMVIERENTSLFNTHAVIAEGPGHFQGSYGREYVEYDGNFFKNRFHDTSGNATLNYGSYLKFIGCFQDGYRHGRGTLYKLGHDSKEFIIFEDGEWYEDKFVSGTRIDFNGNPHTVQNGIYDGPVVIEHEATAEPTNSPGEPSTRKDSPDPTLPCDEHAEPEEKPQKQAQNGLGNFWGWFQPQNGIPSQNKAAMKMLENKGLEENNIPTFWVETYDQCVNAYQKLSNSPPLISDLNEDELNLIRSFAEKIKKGDPTEKFQAILDELVAKLKLNQIEEELNKVDSREFTRWKKTIEAYAGAISFIESKESDSKLSQDETFALYSVSKGTYSVTAKASTAYVQLMNLKVFLLGIREGLDLEATCETPTAAKFWEKIQKIIHGVPAHTTSQRTLDETLTPEHKAAVLQQLNKHRQEEKLLRWAPRFFSSEETYANQPIPKKSDVQKAIDEDSYQYSDLIVFNASDQPVELDFMYDNSWDIVRINCRLAMISQINMLKHDFRFLSLKQRLDFYQYAADELVSTLNLKHRYPAKLCLIKCHFKSEALIAEIDQIADGLLQNRSGINDIELIAEQYLRPFLGTRYKNDPVDILPEKISPLIQPAIKCSTKDTLLYGCTYKNTDFSTPEKIVEEISRRIRKKYYEKLAASYGLQALTIQQDCSQLSSQDSTSVFRVGLCTLEKLDRLTQLRNSIDAEQKRLTSLKIILKILIVAHPEILLELNESEKYLWLRLEPYPQSKALIKARQELKELKEANPNLDSASQVIKMRAAVLKVKIARREEEAKVS